MRHSIGQIEALIAATRRRKAEAALLQLHGLIVAIGAAFGESKALRKYTDYLTRELDQ